MPSSTLLEACNRTELYQICQHAKLNAHPSTLRQQLLALLLGEEEPTITETDHPIDSLRHALIGFINEYWSMLETQLICPARTKDPRSCFGCIDAQVVTCVADPHNAQNEHLIQLHRPRRD